MSTDSDEIIRLRDVCNKLATVIDWLDAYPIAPSCDYKCDYKRKGVASECYCGIAEWDAKCPSFVDPITHRIQEN